MPVNPFAFPWFWRAVSVVFVLGALVSGLLAVLIRPAGADVAPRRLPAAARVVVPDLGFGQKLVIVGELGGRERVDVAEDLGCTAFGDTGHELSVLGVDELGVSSSDPTVTVDGQVLAPLAALSGRVRSLSCTGPATTSAQPLYLVSQDADLAPIRLTFGFAAVLFLCMAPIAFGFSLIRRPRSPGGPPPGPNPPGPNPPGRNPFQAPPGPGTPPAG